MQPVKYSVILPAYNEADNLSVLLPHLIEVLTRRKTSYEILVVDSHLPLDHTPVLCQQLGVTHLLRAPTNNYGDAVRSGIARATGERIIFMDADGSHDPDFLNKMLDEADGYDLIIASRYILGGSTHSSILLVAMSKALNLFYSFVLRSTIRDISNSFRVYRASQLKQLTLNCQHFDIIQEILFGLTKKFKPFKVKEIPFDFKKRISGKSKRNFFVFVWSYFLTLFKLAALKGE